jgi:hypothetical protein
MVDENEIAVNKNGSEIMDIFGEDKNYERNDDMVDEDPNETKGATDPSNDESSLEPSQLLLKKKFK